MRRAVVAVVSLAAAGVLGACGGPSGSDASAGSAIYRDSCASCHGVTGGGGVGPALGDGAVVESYPDEADQVAVVTEGRGSMPAFEGTLSDEQIAEVVRYTRDDLGR